MATTALVALLFLASLPYRAFTGAEKGELVALSKYAPTPDFDERAFGLLSFNGATRTPRWTLECLDKASLVKNADREGMGFHVDEHVPPEFSPRPADYLNSGFDEGHHAAAANHERSVGALRSTFTLANAAPQTAELNRGQWKDLEAHVRSIALLKDVRRVWVLTAPAWLPSSHTEECSASAGVDGKCVHTYRFHAIGQGRVCVPSDFGKSILVERFDKAKKVTLEMHSWFLPNAHKIDGTFDEYACSTDELERAIGLDLWASLPRELQDKLEAEE